MAEAGILSKGITLSYKGENFIHTITDAEFGQSLTIVNKSPESMSGSYTTDEEVAQFVGGTTSGQTITRAYVDPYSSGSMICFVHGDSDSFFMNPLTDVVTMDDTVTALENLQEIPEIGDNAPEKVDVTVFSDDEKKSISGLGDSAQDLAFKFLYEKEQFEKLAALEGSREWCVTLPDGTTATFNATPSVKLSGVGVSAALTYTLSLSVESEIVFA